MRPILLELRGFTSFVDATTINFEGLDAFALVGPTGSGKSSIIDAICFALYGKVPRYGDRTATAGVISTGSNELAVRFTFSVGDERYVVIRVVRRKGRDAKPQTADARLERIGPTATEVLAGSVRDLDRCIDGVVGLSFEHFTRCVVLPQGEFARFLHDEPKDRRSLLIRLLDLGVYEEMRRRADELGREAKVHADLIDRQILQFEARAIDLDAVVARGSELADLAARIDAALPRLAVIDADERSASDRVDRADGHRRRLDAISVPDGIEGLSASTREAKLAVAIAGREREVVERSWQAAVERQSSVMSPAQLRDLIEKHGRAERGIAVVQGLSDAAAEQESALAQASAAVVSERAERDRALRAHAAHALAATLSPGEPCPVCRRLVEKIPVDVDAPVLDHDGRVSRAELREAAARSATQAASTKLATQAERLAALHDELSVHPLVEQLHVLVVEAEQVAATADSARTDLGAARAAHRTTEQQVERLTLAAERHGAIFHERRDGAAELEPPAPSGDLALDWVTLAAWATERRAAVVGERLAASEAVAAATRRRRDELAVLGIDDARSVDGVRQLIVREQAEVEHRIAQHESDRVAVVDLSTESQARRRDGQVAASLALHLQSGRFQNWLVTEALEMLAEAASERLFELSHGQFTLEYRGDEFAVVDHAAAGERRPARSLSGGETFQASLALALALADQVMNARAGSAGRLESIFLDEGFGTLDAECLDTVASAIDRLHSDGRMVGIVTHVPELAQRLPVRFRVKRGPGTSVIEREVG